MTQTHRILLNIVATYGRSLYALAIGLFCGRWTLMALGEVDYGLIGVVGGLVGFLGFLNGILSGAIGRFFSVAIGEESRSPVVGLEKCRMWFTTALVGMFVWPTCIMAVGYPLGQWAVLHYLNIPTDRVAECVWVWRFVCISFWVSVVLSPFSSMYGAKQYIAELTVYSFATSTLNVCFVYYMLRHPGVWLAKFSGWTCLLSIFPTIIIAARAYFLFPECRVVRKHLACWRNIRKMLSFSGWNMVSWLGGVTANEGCMILINKTFGPAANAGVNVGMNLSGHAQSLGGSMIGAFSPAIMNAYGAGDYELMKKLVYRIDKIGTLCILIFALPLALEVDEVLLLWLKEPPAWAAGCCILALIHAIADKMSIGHLIAINAKGIIAEYQLKVGVCWLFVLPLACFFVFLGGGVYSALLALIIARIYAVFARVWFARKLLLMSARKWIQGVLIPIVSIVIVALFAGILVGFCVERSFGRIVLTTIIVEIVLLSLAWRFLADAEERSYALSRLRSVFYYRKSL